MKQTNNKKLNSKKGTMRILYGSITLVFLVSLWWLLSVTAFKNTSLIPTPVEVMASLFDIAKSGKVFRAVANTLGKSLLGFFVSLFLGLMLAIFAALSLRVRYLLSPLVPLIRSFPTLAITMLVLMWYSADTTAVVVGVMVILPIFYTTLLSALDSVDKKLIEMARIYRLSPFVRVSQIYLPSITPSIFSSAASSLGLIIKVVIASEIIGIPRNSIGVFLSSAYNSYDYSAMFAWIIAALALSFLLEGIIALIKRYCMCWQYPHKAATARFFRRVFKRGRAGNDANR